MNAKLQRLEKMNKAVKLVDRVFCALNICAKQIFDCCTTNSIISHSTARFNVVLDEDHRELSIESSPEFVATTELKNFA